MVATGDGSRNSAAGTASPATLGFSADQPATGPANGSGSVTGVMWLGQPGSAVPESMDPT
jgi:hypothetical protein